MVVTPCFPAAACEKRKVNMKTIHGMDFFNPDPGPINETGPALYPRLHRTSWSEVTDRNAGVNITLQKPLSYFQEGYPAPFAASNGRPAVACLVQKAGSIR